MSLRGTIAASKRGPGLLAVAALLIGAISGFPQQPAPAAQGAETSASASEPAPELTTREQIPTFKVNVRLVQVRVVARDRERHAVGDLTRDDFQLFDNGKLQLISKFEVERPGTQVAQEQQKALIPEQQPTQELPHIGERYVAYLFDDVHLNIGDLQRVRDAAEKHLASLQPTDRVAIFTTSGQHNLDFTDDRQKVSQALFRMQPLSRNADLNPCPYMTYYMADLIVNRKDAVAEEAAARDTLACAFANDPTKISLARAQAASSASQKLVLGDSETQLAIQTLRSAVRRASVMPGRRQVVLVSPGFLTLDYRFETNEVVDLAVRANVVISSLDARGLYVVEPPPSASMIGPITGIRLQYDSESARAESDVLAELADGTGGSFFHNSNDLLEGFRRTAGAPEYYYVLGFSPQNLKLDGRFHSLKITVRRPGLLLQARRGYYAPKHLADPDEQAKQEIEEAVFSRDEVHDLPVQLHTQFFKANDGDAKLSVLVHVTVKQLHFDKVAGRNRNDLTVVAALFDRNGIFVTGNEKVLKMRWRDDTLANQLGSGITLKSSFDVKPGSYLVRLVVRDSQGQLSTESGAIEIP